MLPMKNKLTAKQERFVAEYLIDLNATQAAIRAGYSEKTANAQAGRLLVNVSVQNAIRESKLARSERVLFDADDVLRSHVTIHNLDIADIIDKEGAVLPIKQWPKEWRTNISSIEIQEIGQEGAAIGQLKKFKWPSKLDNLKALGQHVAVGAYSEHIKQSIDAKINVQSLSDDELNARITQLLGKARAS